MATFLFLIPFCYAHCLSDQLKVGFTLRPNFLECFICRIGGKSLEKLILTRIFRVLLRLTQVHKFRATTKYRHTTRRFFFKLSAFD